MATLPASAALQDQEVRRAGCQLDIRGADDRSAIKMRGDLGMVRFGHASDFLGFQDAALGSRRPGV